MRRKNSEINVFSMSALDLFASALGAFILLTVIFLPFFPNTGNHAGVADAIIQRLAAAEAEVDSLTAASAQKDQQIAALNATVAAAQKAAADSQQAMARIEKRKTILGIQTDKQKIVILIDMSGSMNYGADFRPVMTKTVSEVLDSLSDSDEVALIGFHAPNERITTPRYPGAGYQSVGPGRAGLNSQTGRWMAQVDGGTPTLAAFEQAFALSPEAIIILTDGAPTVPDDNVEAVLQRIQALNTAQTEIHAVAIGPFYENADFIRFLSRLTSANKGALVAAVP